MDVCGKTWSNQLQKRPKQKRENTTFRSNNVHIDILSFFCGLKQLVAIDDLIISNFMLQKENNPSIPWFWHYVHLTCYSIEAVLEVGESTVKEKSLFMHHINRISLVC